MADEDNNNTNTHRVQPAPPTPTHNPNSNDRCVICLEGLSDPCELVPCGHYNFDVGCIGAWLAESSRCPLCKALISQIIRGPRGLPGRLVNELRSPAEILAARLWPRSSSSSSSRPRYTRADFAAAAAAAYIHTTLPAPPRPRMPLLTLAFVAPPPPPPQPTTTPTTTTTTLSTPFTPPPRDDVNVRLRRDVHARGLYSLHVGSNPISRYRELTPALFRRDAQLQARARTFLRRELRVFDFVPATRVAFLVEYVVAMLKTMDAIGGAAQALLAAELGTRPARLLLHELRAWLRSPYASLGEWDLAVQYPQQLEGWRERLERQNRLQVREEREREREQERGEYKFDVWPPNGENMPYEIGYERPSANAPYAHASMYGVHTYPPYRQQ